jgi:hypothetical protein
MAPSGGLVRSTARSDDGSKGPAVALWVLRRTSTMALAIAGHFGRS